jgi:predicted MFS family arabinose efflux permease
MLVAWAVAPRRLSYLVVLALTVVAVVAVARLPESGERGREPWRPQWPRVPPELRGAFARVSLTAASLWAAVALLLSIVPKDVQELLGTKNLAALGAVAALAFAASCAAQIVSQRRGWVSRRAQAAGLALLVAGLVALVLTSAFHSLAVLFAGSLVAGAGHGIGVLGAQDELNAIAPADRRGEVTSAYIGCIYLAVATAVIGSGLLDRWLSLQAAVAAIALTLALVATLTAVWQLRASSRAPASARARRSRG